MKPKNAVQYACLWGMLLFAVACQPVNSSELKTTKAADLRITGRVYEYKDNSTAKVTSQMQTLASHVGIALDQGETLVAMSDTQEGLTDKVFLSNAYIFNLDNSYDGYVLKTVGEGDYHITYTDMDDEATTASFATGTVSDVITPAEGATLTGETVTVTWDPLGTSGATSLYVSWSGGNASGISTKYCENAGSCTVNIKGMAGTGKLELRGTTNYSSMTGFGEADIDMINISQRNVKFSGTTITGQSFNKAIKAAVSDDEVVDNILNECLRDCEEGETAVFTVAGEEYSCCVEK